MLWRCGHTEKAVALMQGMLEFNVMTPQMLLDAPHDDQVSFFEAFWGSTAPRVGENRASGWSKWIEEKGDIESYTVTKTKRRNDYTHSKQNSFSCSAIMLKCSFRSRRRIGRRASVERVAHQNTHLASLGTKQKRASLVSMATKSRREGVRG